MLILLARCVIRQQDKTFLIGVNREQESRIEKSKCKVSYCSKEQGSTKTLSINQHLLVHISIKTHVHCTMYTCKYNIHAPHVELPRM